jgi:hypothetical protein
MTEREQRQRLSIHDLPTTRRRTDAARTLGELLDGLGVQRPANLGDLSEPPGNYVYLVAPPGLDGVAKIGMGTVDRVRRWTTHGWQLIDHWRTGAADQSRELERTALGLLARAGALDTPRLRELRRGFSSFDGVTEWFDTTVARVSISLSGDGAWSVTVEDPRRGQAP